MLGVNYREWKCWLLHVSDITVLFRILAKWRLSAAVCSVSRVNADRLELNHLCVGARLHRRS